MAYDLQTILNHVEQIRRAIYGEEVRGSISDSIELMAYETATVGEFKDTMTSEMDKFKELVNSDIKTFKENMLNNHIEFTQEVNGKITEFTKDIENKFENFTIKMDTEFKSFKDDTTKTISEFTAKVLGDYKEFTDNVTKEITSMKEEMTKHKQEVDGILADYLKQLNDTLATQKSELEQMKKEIEDKLAEAGQANPNLELIDAREGEKTLKENLNKNYASNVRMEQYVKDSLTPVQKEVKDISEKTLNLESRTSSIEEQIKEGGLGGINVTSVTHKELLTLIETANLEVGGVYLINDYLTIYQQTGTGKLSFGQIEELYSTATSKNTLAPIVYSKKYPEDLIYYDPIPKEIMENAKNKGTILRRVDTKRNISAPWDFRAVAWGRFRPHPTQFKLRGGKKEYSTWKEGEKAVLDTIYKEGNSLYVASCEEVPTSITDTNVFICIYEDISKYLLPSRSLELPVLKGNITFMVDDTIDTQLSFEGGASNIHIGDGSSNIVILGTSGNIEIGSKCQFITIGDRSYRITIHADSSNILMPSQNTDILIQKKCGHIVFTPGGWETSIGLHCNVILIGQSSNLDIKNISSYIRLGNHCFNIDISNYVSNVFMGGSCKSNSIGIDGDNIRFSKECSQNTIKNVCQDIAFGSSCHGNTINAGCSKNTFSSSCKGNLLGQKCENNTFGSLCEFNTLGNRCSDNIFNNVDQYITLGSHCSKNVFEDVNTDITLGSSCDRNKFDKMCKVITVNNSCRDIVFGTQTKNVIVKSLKEKDLSELSETFKDKTITIQQSSENQFIYWYIDTDKKLQTEVIP